MATHVTAIDRELVDLAAGRNKRLIIQMPPRHGKSELCSKYFPAWFLGVFPTKNVILTSATDDLAMDFSVAARDLLQEHGHLFGTSLRQDRASAQRWGTTEGGGLRAAGVGGAIMGRGADCLTGGTIITTEDGPQRIDTLVQSCYTGRVLSYDHGQRRPVWRRVLAHRELYAKEILQVTTESGRILRCTPDHRFYCLQQGYREARYLRPGDAIIGSVCELRSKGIQGRQGLPEVLSRLTSHHDANGMRMVSRELQSAAVRREQTDISRTQRRLLLKGVFRGAPCGQEQAEVRRLRRASERQDAEVLPKLPGQAIGVAPRSKRKGMRAVRRAIPASNQSANLLQAVVRQYGPCCADDWQGQFALQGGAVPASNRPEDESIDFTTRQPQMRRLRKCRRPHDGQATRPGARQQAVTACSSPYRRESQPQCGKQSRDTLPHLPCDPSQIEADTIRSIAKVRGGGESVYDIQVEGTSNFFAGGVLVHNCLIIDDYFKNVEEALSENVRRKMYQWYLTTSQSRLSPTGVQVIIATRWHYNDLIGEVIKTAAVTGDEWRVVSFPAIGDDGAALWPEQWPLELLEPRRQQYCESGYPWMWDALYQQIPPEQIDSYWPPEYFTDIWTKDWPEPSERLITGVALDPSVGESDKSDYSAFVAGCKGHDGVYYVDANIEKRDIEQIVDRGVEWMRGMKPDWFGCETNQFQKLLLAPFRRALPSIGIDDSQVIGIKNTSKGSKFKDQKVTRIRTLTTWLAQGRIKIRRSPGSMLLVEQLRGFPGMKNDDGPDALEMVIRVCEEMLGGAGLGEPEPEVMVA